MIRIGIVGSDSTHADAFGSIVNLVDNECNQYRYSDCRITSIYGVDEERTIQVAKECNIPYIAKDVNEMVDMVDAVMIVLREGNLHLSYALPFLKAGKPTWIDKPITISNKDCKELLQVAKECQTLITGGSTCKYMEDVQIAKLYVNQPTRLGKVLAASMNYPADVNSGYGGIYFYGHHLCEMCLQIFGYNPVSVIATEGKHGVTAIVKYEEYAITLNFLKDAPEHMIMIHGSKTTIIRELDSPKLPYYNGFDQFVSMLRTNRMPHTHKELFGPVALMNTIVKAYETGKESEIEVY